MNLINNYMSNDVNVYRINRIYSKPLVLKKERKKNKRKKERNININNIYNI